MTADMILKLSPQYVYYYKRLLYIVYIFLYSVDEVASILEAPVNHKLLCSQVSLMECGHNKHYLCHVICVSIS